MNMAKQERNPVIDSTGAVDYLRREVGIVAGRLAKLLRARFSTDVSPVAPALAFLDHTFNEVGEGKPLEHWQEHVLERFDDRHHHPLLNVIRGFSLNEIETDVILLAGLAEEHEGFADIFRTLHPAALPRPTVGLAAQLLCGKSAHRIALRRVLESGRAVTKGILRLTGESPFFARSLQLADKLWSVLHGIDTWPDSLAVARPLAARQGLDQWLETDVARRAQGAIRQGAKCTVLVCAEQVDTAYQRAVALASVAGVTHVGVQWPREPDTDSENLLQIHALTRRILPIVKLPEKQEGPQPAPMPDFGDYKGPLMLCSETGFGGCATRRPLISVPVERLSPVSLREMWRLTLPALADEANLLAARYPVEPVQAEEIAADLDFLHKGSNQPPTLADVKLSVRARSTTVLDGGVTLLRPRASWEQLVLPDVQRNQLLEAVNRIYLQAKVLDEWGFLQGRRGARGVRMLFAGPPGTGKTLSAEVLSQALGVDMLVVDLSRVVSKWIGETEKNLARVFNTAERAKAVLFFDEADALFGKRTEVSDAHDRYANLETAYLLARLESYDGLAILATNLRQNIDAAFTRRLEFIVEYDEPGMAERLALWRCHLPAGVPLADDVDIEELAAQFPIVGGLIRNAAVAAAFLAANEDSAIGREHFIQAIRREYEKSGKPYRELSAR